jgi:hypothetical protein
MLPGITSSNKALIIALGSATIAVVCIMRGKSHGWTLFDLGCVWSFTADWVAGRWSMPVREAAMLKLQGIPRIMSTGGKGMIALAIVVWLNGSVF